MQQTHRKINERKWKWFHLFLQFLFYLMMQQQTQKTRFFNVGHTRKSQIAGIIQASWHNNISTFKYSILQQIKKWKEQFAKTYEQTPTYTRKWLVFEKNKCSLLLFTLSNTTYCLLSSNRKKSVVLWVCQYKVLLWITVPLLLSLVGSGILALGKNNAIAIDHALRAVNFLNQIMRIWTRRSRKNGHN